MVSPCLSPSVACNQSLISAPVTVRRAILTSSYAGSLSLHSPAFGGAGNLTFNGHDQSVLSCCYVANPSGAEGSQWVASGGMDRVGRVWEYQVRRLCSIEHAADSGQTPSLDPAAPLPVPTTLYKLNLHTGPIASVRSHILPLAPTASVSPHLLTAGWDGIIGVWDLTKGVNEGEQSEEGGERKKKRRKAVPGVAIGKVRTLSSSQAILTSPVPRLCPARAQRQGLLRRFRSCRPQRCVLKRLGPHRAQLGPDHCVRDCDQGTSRTHALANTDPLQTSDKTLLSLVQLASPNLLATGSTDRLISLWDLRESTQNISLSLSGHLSQVSCLAAHPTSPVLLASGSYDSTVRIWDARSTKQALFVINLPPKEGEEAEGNGREKILAIDWDGERLVAGGEGARVVVWRVTGGAGEPVVEA